MSLRLCGRVAHHSPAKGGLNKRRLPFTGVKGNPSGWESVAIVSKWLTGPGYRFLAVSRGTDETFHVVERVFECASSLSCQAVSRLRNSSLKLLLTEYVLTVFELTCVNAEISVRSFQQFLQFVE